MENVMHLVRSLQTGELKLLRHFYKFQKDNESKKINLLFEIALKHKNSKRKEDLDHKALLELYNGSRKYESSLGKLKCRLKNDIMNILLLQNSSQKFEAKHDMAIYDCRRMLLQGEILMGRGMHSEGIGLLEKASFIAEKNELFAEQILIDELCRNYTLLRSGEDAFRQFMKRIDKNTSLLEKVQFAKYFHYEMTASRLFNPSSIQPVEEWENKLSIIKKDYEASGSVKIGYYYNLSAMNFYREVYQFEKSLEYGLQLQKDCKANEILKTPFYSGKINMELAKCYLLMEQYDKAIVHANHSITSFDKDMLKELTSLEILLQCHVMKGENKKVDEILTDAFLKLSMQPDEFIFSKWQFLKAGVEFRRNDLNATLLSLKECNGLMKNKSGWLLAYSLFEVMCKIETGNLEWMEYRSEALKKLMHRYNKSAAAGQNKRFYLIYKVLRKLHKNNYDYVQTVTDERDNIMLLAETKYSYSWHMSGQEPVPFDRWVKEKAAQQLKDREKKSKKLVA
jgi:hypothetical protein